MAEHGELARSVILFNCGATKSLARFLRPNMTIYVIDSRRPFDLDNVYFDDNIRLFASHTEKGKFHIPTIEEIEITDSSYSGSSESDDDLDEVEAESVEEEMDEEIDRATSGESSDEDCYHEEEEVEIPRSSDTELETAAAAEHIAGSTEQTGTEGSSGRRKRVHDSAVLMLEIAHSIGRTNVEMMWSAVIGLSSQLAEYLISHSFYTATCFDRLRPFIRKFIPESTDATRGDDMLRLSNFGEIFAERQKIPDPVLHRGVGMGTTQPNFVWLNLGYSNHYQYRLIPLKSAKNEVATHAYFLVFTV
ncbi:unnamed protein product [Gongylonema pulchrum]|uniref:Methyltransferase n=1 Tax=Gongylonema pulchrum TaxID=637853 RepID=A0A183E1M8_9BILA|nr:unnamed protein product [Gongylonema pulchrum]